MIQIIPFHQSVRRGLLSIILCFIFLQSQNVSAGQESFTVLSNSVMTAMHDPNFAPINFCNHFWIESSRETCLRALPWKFMHVDTAALVKEILLSEDAAFLTIKFQIASRSLSIPFSAVRRVDGWWLDYDNLRVWAAFASFRRWSVKDYDGGKLLFAKEPSEDVAAAIAEAVSGSSRSLAQVFQVPNLNSLNYYFLNDKTEAEFLGIDWQPEIGGSARNGFMILFGSELEESRLELTLRHELVHEYTVYNHTWSPIQMPHAFLSEGIAEWATELNVDIRKMPCEIIAWTYKGLKTPISYLNQGKSALSLLNNDSFREFDSSSEGQPAYRMSASFFKVVNRHAFMPVIRDLWNKLANMDDVQKMIFVITDITQITPKQLDLEILNVLEEDRKLLETEMLRCH